MGGGGGGLSYPLRYLLPKQSLSQLRLVYCPQVYGTNMCARLNSDRIVGKFSIAGNVRTELRGEFLSPHGVCCPKQHLSHDWCVVPTGVEQICIRAWVGTKLWEHCLSTGKSEPSYGDISVSPYHLLCLQRLLHDWCVVPTTETALLGHFLLLGRSEPSELWGHLYVLVTSAIPATSITRLVCYPHNSVTRSCTCIQC